MRHYVTTLANEQIKRRAGATTLIDIINIEDRLTGAQQGEIQARQAYANAITQLLHESGRLIRKHGENQFEVALEALLRLTTETAGMMTER
ncbi:hypothetical protein CCP3SC15_4430003 [Gammaproteobacteria bacterium]